ncbi:MAG: Ig-like domain-containing protein [Salinivirgaceae bacterium]|jgi:hypothetical protein|nr:Ig-like domain-containing protein [Salinivirgaceae bacterium]
MKDYQDKNYNKLKLKKYTRIEFALLTTIIIMLLLGLSIITKAQIVSPYLLGNNYWYPGSTVNSLLTPGGKMEKASFQTIRIGGFGANGYTDTEYKEYIETIQAMGAEPLVQVRDNLTTQQTIDFITYINVTNSLNVKYWSIGNEPDHDGGGNQTTTQIATYFKRIAAALKSVDPTITILGPDHADYKTSEYGALLGGTDDITGKVPGEGYYYLDIVTFHRYDITDASEIEWVINDLTGKIATINTGRDADKQLSWGIGEFNSHYNNDKTTDEDKKTWSFNAGQFFAELYGEGMKKEAFTMCAWSIYEGKNDGDRMGTDLSLFDVENLTGRSSYYHTLLLGQNMRENYATNFDNQADVDIVAMKDADSVSVMILNRSKTVSFNYNVALNNAYGTTQDLTIAIDAGISAEHNGFINSESTHMLVFNNTGTLIKRYIYTSAQSTTRTAPITEDVNSAAVVFFNNVQNGDELYKAGDLSVSVIASDFVNTVSKVQLFYDNVLVNQDNTAPFEWATESSALNNLVPGTHTLNAIATLSNGSTKDSTISFFVNDTYELPAIKYNYPANNDFYAVGSNMTVQVDATHSKGINNVKLYFDEIALHQENLASYDWTNSTDAALSNLTKGTHTLRALATSKATTSGIITTNDTSITILVADPTDKPAITFTSPVNNDTIAVGDDITLFTDITHFNGIDYAQLYFDDDFVRQENLAPYTWGENGQNDDILTNISEGWHKLKVLAAAEDGIIGQDSIYIFSKAPSVLDSISISPEKDTIKIGESINYKASGFDQYGASYSISETWSTSGGGTITSSGIFTATTIGDFTISATVNSISAQAQVHIVSNRVLSSMQISPIDTSIVVEDSVQYTAIAYDQFDEIINGNISYSINGGESISNDGLYKASSTGNFIVTATNDTVSASGSIEVTALPVLSKIEIIPTSANFIIGDSTTFIAKPYDQFDKTISSNIVWTISGGGTINTEGFFTAETEGEFVVTATDDTISAKASIQIFSSSFLTTIEIKPTADSIFIKDSILFTAIGFDQTGDSINTTIIWSTNGGGDIDSNGLFIANTSGQYLITATDDAIFNSATITIFEAPEVTQLIISPDTAKISIGDSIKFNALAFDQVGKIIACTPTWNTSGGGTIDSTGYLSASSKGEFTITASGNGIIDSAIVIINEVPFLSNLVLLPENDTIFVGDVIEYTATGFDQNGDPIIVSPAYSVSGGGTINEAGIFTATSSGIFEVKAKVNNISTTSTINIKDLPYLTLIDIKPDTANVYVGKSFQFDASGVDQYEDSISATLNWSITGGGTINEEGLFTADSIGEFKVIASASNVSDTAELMVKMAPVLTKIEVVPGNTSLYVGDTIAFKAFATDQYGHAISTNIKWSINGGGNINYKGLFIAEKSGYYEVNACSDTLYALAKLSIKDSTLVNIIPGIIESSDYSLMQGIELANHFICLADSNDWMEYQLNVIDSGKYSMHFVTTNTEANSFIEVSFNNTVLDSLTLSVSNNNDSLPVLLNKGEYTLKLKVLGGKFDLEKIEFRKSIELPEISFTTPVNLLEIPGGSDLQVQVDAKHSNGIEQVDLFVNNLFVRSENSAPFNWGDNSQNDKLLNKLPLGTYMLKAEAKASSGELSSAYITVKVVADTSLIDSIYFNSFTVLESGKSHKIDVNYISQDTNLIELTLLNEIMEEVSANSINIEAGTSSVTLLLSIPENTVAGINYNLIAKLKPRSSIDEVLASESHENIEITTTTAIALIENQYLQIYPIPSKDILYIKGINTLTELCIYNSIGKLQLSYKLNKQERNKINISELKSGLYIVQFKSKSTTISKRLLKQ